MLKKNSGGFVLIEFAIALPLLIFLLYGLATVSIKIFELGRTQLADYVLESEAQYVMNRLSDDARAAKTIELEKVNDALDKITIVYHTVETDTSNNLTIADLWETQIFVPNFENDAYRTLNAKRKDEGPLGNPITGGNFFGDTKINRFKFDKRGKILHVALEMESLLTGKKIRLNTAIFMPACEN